MGIRAWRSLNQGIQLAQLCHVRLPSKTSMTMETQPVEDVSPIKNCGFSSVIVFLGGF